MEERVYEWEVARIGDESPPVRIAVTADLICQYMRVCRYSRIPPEEAVTAAPPGMVFVYAPMRRDLTIAAAGYVAPEQAATNPRATPYVASRVTLYRPVRPGDTITSTTRTFAKYERKGNKFIDFLIRAHNQKGERVAEYLYTCLWLYAKGQAPRSQGADGGGAPPRGEGGPVLRGEEVRWESLWVGAVLPTQSKVETQETINAYAAFRRMVLGARQGWRDLHTDPGFARGGIFGETVNMGVATADYVFQVLQEAFPPEALFSPDSRYVFKAVSPIRAGDTVTISGAVVEKREEEGRRLAVCELTGVNQGGRVVYTATATLAFP
jgi:acyl dehydratase